MSRPHQALSRRNGFIFLAYNKSSLRVLIKAVPSVFYRVLSILHRLTLPTEQVSQDSFLGRRLKVSFLTHRYLPQQCCDEILHPQSITVLPDSLDTAFPSNSAGIGFSILSG